MNEMAEPVLVVRGATEHNLREVDLDLPHGRLIAFSGVSGSGKTSLVFDTIYAEARRRFLVALDRSEQAVTRRLRPPRVRRLEGLAPAVAIAQTGRPQSPRATVATLSGVHDLLRLLWTRVGEPHCVACGAPVRSERFEELHDAALGLPAGTQLLILAPRWLQPGEDEAAFLAWTDRSGYRRIRAGTELMTLEDATPEALRGKPLAVVVDRLVIRPDTGRRLKGSLEAAVQAGDGRVCLVDPGTGWERSFAVRPACSACGAPFRPLEPALFSFNSLRGACPTCRGLGVQQGLGFDQLFADGRATLEEALGPLWREFGHAELQRHLERFCRQRRLDPDLPVGAWPGAAAAALWDGPPERATFPGLSRWLDRLGRRARAAERSWLDGFVGEAACAACNGARLRPEALAVTVAGRTIAELCARPLAAVPDLLGQIRADGPGQVVVEALTGQLGRSLALLSDLGLGYLTLDRPGDTLSSGEYQRLRLGAALGSRMTRILYVLDEPSLGLHARDTDRLLTALEALRDAGNTVLVVEHDPAILRRADLLVDLGPGAGPDGGRIVARGTPDEVAAGDSLTGQYLAGARRLPPRPARPAGTRGWLRLENARGHNLKGISVAFPLGSLTCVTGVSGSGKSTLVQGTLYPALAGRFHGAEVRPLPHDACLGAESLERVVAADQRPIGRTPRSNLASYTGLLTPVRRLFAEMPESRLRAYRPSHFSFNAADGACPECGGSGMEAVRQGLLEDLEIPCATCDGSRYRTEVLDVRYRGLTIAETLDLTVGEAADRFDAVPEIAARLRLLQAVGLGYLRLGHSTPRLSGGEAQRIKLAAQLGRPGLARTLYLLDEPTTGLRLEDVRFLLELLRRLVDEGSTVVVVEHHLEFAAATDWIIDLGPEAGDEGGWVVAAGTPEEVARVPESRTGQYLAQRLAQSD
ncbi:MAG: excinuclease ABC subunit UvrA [Candidatus Latescibacterota bacterium]|jgi:excinuclease ABC subunit A